MMHPDTCLNFVSEIIGCGVFAKNFIPKGTIVWVLDDLDQKFDAVQIESLDRLRHEKAKIYTWRDREGKYILPWDIAQFVNHSFKANCMMTPYDFEIAIADIYPGEELTDDYAFCNEDEPFDCLPEEGIARTKVMPDDLLRYYPEWDKQLAEAMMYIDRVKQPLQHLIAPKYRNKINAIAEGKESIDSVLTCYYDRSSRLIVA